MNSRLKEEIVRNHTCPVVYLQNFANLCSQYVNKLEKYTIETYKPPRRKDYCLYAHDKIKNGVIFQTTVENIGVKKHFYAPDIEEFFKVVEAKVSKVFRKFRRTSGFDFFDPFPIYQFIMNQLIRTPKFQRKLEKDQKFLKEMSNEEFKKTPFFILNVKKPNEVTNRSLQELHTGMIKSNLLTNMYKWCQFTLVTNFTNTPFISSDCPVIYNELDFIPSVLKSEDKLEPTLIGTKNMPFMFPVSPVHLILIQNFDNSRKEALFEYEEIFNPDKILIIDMLLYQFAERFIIFKKKNKELVQKIRKMCRDKMNRDYILLEDTYKEWSKRVNKLIP